MTTATGAAVAWIRWPGYLAWVFLGMLPLAVLTVRSGQWQQGLLLYAICSLLSLLLLGYFGLLSVLPQLREQRRSLLLRGLPALPGAVLLILAMQGGNAPPIHDITTDTIDPPVFEVVPTRRAADANSLDVTADVREQQRAAYPELDTLHSSRSYTDVFDAALQLVRDNGWEIVRNDPNAGYIEAEAHTALMNFTDDIAVRVRTGDDGSRIDLRSASRVGISDLGTNAARIREFLAQLRTRLGDI